MHAANLINDVYGRENVIAHLPFLDTRAEAERFRQFAANFGSLFAHPATSGLGLHATDNLHYNDNYDLQREIEACVNAYIAQNYANYGYNYNYDNNYDNNYANNYNNYDNNHDNYGAALMLTDEQEHAKYGNMIR